MELGPKNQNRDGFLGPNSIGSVYGPSGFWDNITHYKTKRVYFWGLTNSATELTHSPFPTKNQTKNRSENSKPLAPKPLIDPFKGTLIPY